MIMGTIVNAVSVTVGSILGVTIGKRIPKDIKESVMNALGLSVIVLG